MNSDSKKTSRIFIEDITHKVLGGNKVKDQLVMKVKDVKTRKWEPKKTTTSQTIETKKKTMR